MLDLTEILGVYDISMNLDIPYIVRSIIFLLFIYFMLIIVTNLVKGILK